MKAKLDTYPVARVDGLAARVAELESENKDLRDRFSDADTERNAAQAGLKDAFIRAAKLEERIKTITDGFRREQNDIEQTCGKVLGYPRYCDDQKNFPGATEKDGVCVGEHVASSIAAELANKYRDLLARCKRLEELGAELRECAGYLGWTSSDDSDCITRAERACEAWDKEAKG